jgi:type II secretory pathway component PulF
MVRRAYSPQQIISKLREAEVHISQGASISEASRKIGVTEQTYLSMMLMGIALPTR